MQTVGFVDAVFRYPMKGCRALPSEFLQCDPHIGIREDRQFVLVSAVKDNPDFPFQKAITQRQCSKLATVRIRPFLNWFVVSMGRGLQHTECELRVHHHRSNESVTIIIQDVTSPVKGVIAACSPQDYFSKLVGVPVHVVCIDSGARRVVVSKRTGKEMKLGFADGHPMLVTNTASLASLNASLREEGKQPVPMHRFRSNIVVSGIEAWEEDSWKMIRIGDTVLEYSQPCGRCPVITIDQVSGERSLDGEPLRTLARLRPAKGGPLFGSYYLIREPGVIEPNASVTLLP